MWVMGHLMPFHMTDYAIFPVLCSSYLMRTAANELLLLLKELPSVKRFCDKATMVRGVMGFKSSVNYLQH